MALLHAVSLSVIIQLLAWYGVDGTPATDQTRDWAQQMGAGEDLDVLHVKTYDLNGGFIKPQRLCVFFQCMDLTRPTIVIFTPTEDSLTTMAILSHEIGHYHQWQSNGLENYGTDSVGYEWEADVIGADQLCRMHYDGVYIMTRLLLNMGVSDEEDTTHRGSQARATNVALKACRPVPQS